MSEIGGPMHKTTKRHFTLLETLIALGITMIILSTLTFFYRQIDAINSQVEIVQKSSFRMRYVENRLAAILPNAVSEADEKKDFFFYTTSSSISYAMQGSPTLLFTYDNGVKLDKLFSNHVLGRLFLDSDGNLCLATWPSPNRWIEGAAPPMKKEVLLERVKELSFGFFVAPDREWQLLPSGAKQQTTPPTGTPPGQIGKTPSAPAATSPSTPTAPATAAVVVKPTPEGQWQQSWSYDYQQLPAMARVQVTHQDGSVSMFVFPLPKCQRQVVYKQ